MTITDPHKGFSVENTFGKFMKCGSVVYVQLPFKKPVRSGLKRFRDTRIGNKQVFTNSLRRSWLIRGFFGLLSAAAVIQTGVHLTNQRYRV